MSFNSAFLSSPTQPVKRDIHFKFFGSLEAALASLHSVYSVGVILHLSDILLFYMHEQYITV